MFRRKGPSEVEIARENEVKIGITNELSTALKMVQKENIGTEDQAVYSTDTANNVCSCIEAIYLHGLKSKAVTKIASYVGLGQEATAQSSLNFWNFVSRFTHGEVIAQLKHLGQITTEIGLCRAWVRVALNDGLMESYIDAMISDTKNLEYFYHRTAYLRDREQPGIMQTYLQGLMNFQFKLSYNASVLNEWSYAPLLLAGVIDTKEAPPPVIKPVGQKPKSSKSSHKERDSDAIVEVRQERSRSHGSSHKTESLDSYNPMEQPKFGQPPDSSYYVTSSEFTSKDVEEFKKLSRNVQRPMSECSSSSHVSAPDPPHMNVSPATYVQKYGVQIGSPSSVRTHGSEEDKSITERQADSNIVDMIKETDAVIKTGSQNFDSVCSNTQVEEEFVKDSVVSSLKVNLEETMSTSQNEDLEESWEEFYKSPVKKIQDEHFQYKKVQRLDSINRDAKEEAILSSIIDTESFDQTDSLKAESEHLHDDSEDRIESIADNVVLSENRDIVTSTNELDVSNATSRDLVYDTHEAHTRDTSELLDESQKLLNELGIEDQFDEEGLKLENQEGEEIIHASTKANKNKKKPASDRLKPKLSLSPPKSDVVEPELSDAVADKVDQIKTLENPEYLSKHRLSLQYSGNVRKTDKYGHRKSLPNVLEHNNENDGEIAYSIEDHIYDGMPLDDSTSGMAKPPVKNDSNEIKVEEERGETDSPTEEELKRHVVDKRNSVGNSLMSGRGWSSSFESEPGDTVDAFSPPRSSMSLPVTRQKSESFGSLLQNYTPASSLSARSVDDVLSNFPSRKDTVYSPEHPDSSVNEDTDNLEDFEVVTSASTDPDPNDMSRMVQFSNIANEKGLDAQNFQCKGCSRAIGLIFGKPRVCKFDGGYYCYECHENDEYYIPALIVHNWDFRKHKVAKKNLGFLMDNEEQPYLNIEEINPRLYDHVQEMQEIKGLRVQLTLLKTYLFTCKQSVAEDLRRLVWPRDYMYENTEQYSLADLLQVPTGALASSLRKVIKFATKHVYGCRLCCQKGFICELCNNPKVIYAFELEATYRCPQCKTVFHKDCKTDNRPCPKCQRRQSRQSYDGSSAIILTPDYDLQI